MSSLLIPGQFTSQPQYAARINHATSLAKKLSTLYGADGSDPLRDSVTGQRLTMNGGVSIVSDPRFGRVFSLNGSSGYLRNTSFTGTSAGYPFTVSAWYNGNGSATGCILALTPAGGTTGLAEINNGTPQTGRIYSSPGNAFVPHSKSDGTWHMLTMVCRADGVDIYIDGAYGDSNNATSTATANTQIDLGARPWEGPGFYYGGLIGPSAVFQGALSAAEIAMLYQSFWSQLLLAPSRKIFVPAAGGGGLPTLTSLVASSVTPTGATLTVN